VAFALTHPTILLEITVQMRLEFVIPPIVSTAMEGTSTKIKIILAMDCTFNPWLNPTFRGPWLNVAILRILICRTLHQQVCQVSTAVAPTIATLVMVIKRLHQVRLHPAIMAEVLLTTVPLHPKIMAQIPLATVVRIRAALVMINFKMLVLVPQVVNVLLKATTVPLHQRIIPLATVPLHPAIIPLATTVVHLPTNARVIVRVAINRALWAACDNHSFHPRLATTTRTMRRPTKV